MRSTASAGTLFMGRTFNSENNFRKDTAIIEKAIRRRALHKGAIRSRSGRRARQATDETNSNADVIRDAASVGVRGGAVLI
ncbi:MAG TPA: hypothetical protein VLY86_02955 [Methanothrix sp.]|nr:hypothetical protein [Methanothrix sp.]